jgi:hypothetical protein
MLVQEPQQVKEVAQVQCLNCGAAAKGAYCYQCGQHVRDNADRSLGRLLSEVFGTIFFFDNRFLLSLKYLLAFPGRMTVEFLAGKRKKFISPVTLFLFFNVIYFFVSPLSDYSLSLNDQMYWQYHSEWTSSWANTKLQNLGISEQAYAPMYQKASDNVSKSIMMINVPLIGLFIYLLAFKKRKFYFDSLIFAFHFFTFYLISWVLLDWVGKLFDMIESASAYASSFFIFFTFGLPFLYAVFSIRKFLRLRWYWAVPAGVWVIAAVMLANLIYRLIIYGVTLLVT